uniref:Uncharacterized protein n=1 Tax=Caenorhabditis japonica TaxID=281687 RepID=A0A8R1HK63_CAEJA
MGRGILYVSDIDPIRIHAPTDRMRTWERGLKTDQKRMGRGQPKIAGELCGTVPRSLPPELPTTVQNSLATPALAAGIPSLVDRPKQSTLPPRGRVDLYRTIYGSIPRPIRFGSVLVLSPTTCVARLNVNRKVVGSSFVDCKLVCHITIACRSVIKVLLYIARRLIAFVSPHHFKCS